MSAEWGTLDLTLLGVQTSATNQHTGDTLEKRFLETLEKPIQK